MVYGMSDRSQNQLDGQEARSSDEAGGAGGNMRPLLINNEGKHNHITF